MGFPGPGCLRTVVEPARSRFPVTLPGHIGFPFVFGIDPEYIVAVQCVNKDPSSQVGLKNHPGGFVWQLDTVQVAMLRNDFGTRVLSGHIEWKENGK